MKTIIRCLTGVLLFALLSFAFASGIRKVSYEKLLQTASMVCVLQVERVESLEKFYHFRDGRKAKTATTTLVRGKVIKSLFGDCGKEQINTRHHTRAAVGYLTDELKKRYTLLRTGSGIEHQVKQGQKYIFTFEATKIDSKPLNHSRMDLLSDEVKLQELIQRIMKN